MDSIQSVVDKVKLQYNVDLLKVVTAQGLNLRAVVPAALGLAAQTELVAHNLLGAQKMRVVQIILNDAIQALHVASTINEEQAKQLRTFVKEQLPWVLEGAIKAAKNPAIAKALNSIVLCCK